MQVRGCHPGHPGVLSRRAAAVPTVGGHRARAPLVGSQVCHTSIVHGLSWAIHSGSCCRTVGGFCDVPCQGHYRRGHTTLFHQHHNTGRPVRLASCYWPPRMLLAHARCCAAALLYFQSECCCWDLRRGSVRPCSPAKAVRLASAHAIQSCGLSFRR